MIELFVYFLLLTLIILINGSLASKILFRKNSNLLNLGETGLVGITFYTFLSFIIHFFFPLNKSVNLAVIIIILILFFRFINLQYLKKSFFSEKKIILISFFMVLLMTIKYKPNEDYGFYHLPYIVNVISEKIIFGLSNIQPHFAWNSSWLNFSSMFNFPIMGLKGILLSNSVLYFFLMIFFFHEIKNNKNNFQLSFYYILFLAFYTIIKFSRISEHGFDFPANYFLLISIYYFIKIFESRDKDFVERDFILLLLFSTLSITIKLSTFASPILVLGSFIVVMKKKIKINKFYYPILFCFCFLFVWIIQQFIYSSCFIPFFEFSCIKSVEWHDSNLSEVLRATTGSVNKSFNQYSGNLSQAEYLKNFNWVHTWLSRNKIEFLEHFAAFIVPILFLILLNIKKILKQNFFTNLKEKNLFFIFLLTFLVMGLGIWFLKSPVIRFGIPYLFLFVFLLMYFIIQNIIKVNLLKGINIILILCITFNVSKNILRIEDFKFNSNLFPKILKNKYSTMTIDGFLVNYPDPEIKSGQSQLCWSIPFICHIEKGRNTSIKIYNNYLFVLKK